MDKNNGFSSEASRLAWELFKQTGEVGYYMLYSHIECPPKELQIDEDMEKDNEGKGRE